MRGGIGNGLLSFIPTAAPSATGTAKPGKMWIFPKRFLLSGKFLGCFILVFTSPLKKSWLVFFFSLKVEFFLMGGGQEYGLYFLHPPEFLGKAGI